MKNKTKKKTLTKKQKLERTTRHYDRNRAVVEDVCKEIISRATDLKERSWDAVISEYRLIHVVGALEGLQHMLITVYDDCQRFKEEQND